MRPTDNVIEEVWLAYAFAEAEPDERLAARLGRVERHFGELVADPLLRSESVGERHGLALWRREDPRLRWPLWIETGGLAAAYSAVPTGWGSVVGDLEPAAAAIALARELDAEPERLAELNPPFVIGLRN